MFLKELRLTKGDEVIQQVLFKPGLNLIVDESSTAQRATGNGVGKTTALRAIDFCLGAKADAMFYDREFRDINKDVYAFLMNPAVTFTLELGPSKDAEPTVSIRRTCDSSGGTIGDEQYEQQEFLSRLKELLFGSAQKKPSARQLLPKFIRIQEESKANTLYYLHSNTKKKIEYPPIFLTLFGYPDLSTLAEWRDAQKKHSALESDRKSFLKVAEATTTRATLKQQLHIIDAKISQLESELKALDVSRGVNDEIEKLDSVREYISGLSKDVAVSDFEISQNEMAIRHLESATVDIDARVVEMLYSEAKLYIPDLTKRLADVLDFHKQMTARKIKYLRSIRGKLTRSCQRQRERLAVLIEEERRLLAAIDEKGALVDFRKTQQILDHLYAEKGAKQSLFDALESCDDKIAKLEETLADLQSDIESGKETVEDHLFTFNRHFASYSDRLYGVSLVLALDIVTTKGQLTVTPQIVNAEGNPSNGMKKGQNSAFDLAYASYLAEISRKGPRFVIHDDIESIHINQIRTLFQIANEIDGQYVVAVLQERIQALGVDFIEANRVLKLSSQDRFFRLL